MNLNTLYKNACQNDKESEKELFKALAARFLYLVRHRIRNRDDYNDVVQNALTAVAANFRIIHIDVSFAAWAQKILENEIILFYRKQKRQQSTFMPIDDSENPFYADKDDQSVRQQLLECLKKVNSANKRYARILTLKYQGFDFDHICGRLKLTRNNAYSLLSRARTMLDECLEKGNVS
jgi:RNA polymerase sigma factor (sigma-70 family)